MLLPYLNKDLFSHQQKRSDDVFFFFLVDECAKRVGSAVGVPNPVVVIERRTVVVMYFAVEGAEVAAAGFAHTDRAFESTVE